MRRTPPDKAAFASDPGRILPRWSLGALRRGVLSHVGHGGPHTGARGGWSTPALLLHLLPTRGGTASYTGTFFTAFPGSGPACDAFGFSLACRACVSVGGRVAARQAQGGLGMAELQGHQASDGWRRGGRARQSILGAMIRPTLVEEGDPHG